MKVPKNCQVSLFTFLIRNSLKVLEGTIWGKWSIWGFKTFYWTPPAPLEELDIAEKAIRADMTIGEGTESGFFDDYYDTENEIVTAQIGVHGEY